MANISPIFKKGEKSNFENYRPVSLTVFYGKVLEKIIKKHIENFLRETNLIHKENTTWLYEGKILFK